MHVLPVPLSSPVSLVIQHARLFLHLPVCHVRLRSVCPCPLPVPSRRAVRWRFGSALAARCRCSVYLVVFPRRLAAGSAGPRSAVSQASLWSAGRAACQPPVTCRRRSPPSSCRPARRTLPQPVWSPAGGARRYFGGGLVCEHSRGPAMWSRLSCRFAANCMLVSLVCKPTAERSACVLTPFGFARLCNVVFGR